MPVGHHVHLQRSLAEKYWLCTVRGIDFLQDGIPYSLSPLIVALELLIT